MPYPEWRLAKRAQVTRRALTVQVPVTIVGGSCCTGGGAGNAQPQEVAVPQDVDLLA